MAAAIRLLLADDQALVRGALAALLGLESDLEVKDTPARELADAVRRVHLGLRVVDPALATETLTAGTSPLTAREREVLAAAADGSTAGVIAARLHLSEGTVRNHLSAAIGKTGT
ncbi:DNA-binding NarL/FixJ family response regulator [Nocardia sp. GAS34]|uniref:response regulator transcription factor n=1 Tax=unclassified Nocardia TaxID=2637762 RepID=UPI003D230ACF